MQRGKLVVVGFSFLTVLAFVGVVLHSTTQPTELFDAEDPDYFDADSTYSASPSRDDSARILYARTGGNEYIPSARAELAGSRQEQQNSESLASNNNGHYRGSLAGRRRMMAKSNGDNSINVAQGAQSLEQLPRMRQHYPTELQRKWEVSALSEAMRQQHVASDPVLKEAASIREKWLEAEQQQQEDRRLYRDRKILYEDPGRPANVAYHLGANARAKELLVVHHEAKKKREQRQRRRREEERREKEREMEKREEEYQDERVVRSRRHHHDVTKKAAVKKPMTVSLGDTDPSHIAALQAVDEALASHDDEDLKESEARHKAAEKLHHKANKLKEISEEQKQKAFALKDKMKRDERHSKQDVHEAKELQREGETELRDSNTESLAQVAPDYEMENANDAQAKLDKDEKQKQMDELKVANEAVRAESLLARHKGIGRAVNAKLQSLRERVFKDSKALSKDRTVLSALESNHKNNNNINIDTANSNNPELARSQRLVIRAKQLRKHAALLKAQVKNTKYASKTILEASKCLEQQAETLENNEGLSGDHSVKLYSQSLKECGLL